MMAPGLRAVSMPRGSAMQKARTSANVISSSVAGSRLQDVVRHLAAGEPRPSKISVGDSADIDNVLVPEGKIEAELLADRGDYFLGRQRACDHVGRIARQQADEEEDDGRDSRAPAAPGARGGGRRRVPPSSRRSSAFAARPTLLHPGSDHAQPQPRGQTGHPMPSPRRATRRRPPDYRFLGRFLTAALRAFWSAPL